MHMLTGRRGTASFAVHVTPREGGGSEVALIDWDG